jgi:hypothetical protein
MILGMSLATFTQFHVILSLIGIVAGIIVALAMLAASRAPKTTSIFLIMTAATDLTGFLFPMPFDPADVIGIISLVFVALASLGLYGYKLAGSWRWIYVASALFSLYLNCFVLVVQTFQKVPFFHALAPTQKEPPFAAAQGVVLVLFIALGIAALRKFRPMPAMPAAVRPL